MKVGSIVQCVKIFTPDLKYNPIVPKYKNYYTVRDFAEYFGRVFIKLDEIVCPMIDTGSCFVENAFAIEGFREVEFPPELEISIEELTNIEIEA